MEPEGFITDDGVYLGLRAVFHRLGRLGSRAAMNESVHDLWNLALRVEDGELSQFERALVECPMCGDKSISRLPTAPHLSMAKAREPQAPAAPVAASAPAPMTMQAAWLRAVIRYCDDPTFWPSGM